MTSPIRSTGMFGLRRISSRTTLTAMSSARVFQKMPCGPARPNAVRTPSTNTTSRRSTTATLCAGFQLCAQILELPTVRREWPAVELNQDRAAFLELAVATRVEQGAVRTEAVARRVDRVLRLVVVARIVLRRRQIREVRDHEVD